MFVIVVYVCDVVCIVDVVGFVVVEDKRIKKRIKKNAPLNDAFLILHYRFKNYLAFVPDVAAAQITTPKAILLTKSAKLYTIFRVPASALPVYPR